jgi:hypothetical protein
MSAVFVFHGLAFARFDLSILLGTGSSRLFLNGKIKQNNKSEKMRAGG